MVELTQEEKKEVMDAINEHYKSLMNEWKKDFTAKALDKAQVTKLAYDKLHKARIL